MKYIAPILRCMSMSLDYHDLLVLFGRGVFYPIGEQAKSVMIFLGWRGGRTRQMKGLPCIALCLVYLGLIIKDDGSSRALGPDPEAVLSASLRRRRFR
ncbi:uncharacterized protein [Lolium perenne]|uniref:uncharacterized protein isoform X1 n=1 Tax=Lolium perenne TaxID=4522 RepID=UPI003A98DAA4